MKSIPRQKQSRPTPGDSHVSHKQNRVRIPQHARADSTPLLYSETTAHMEQLSQQPLRQSMYSPNLVPDSSIDLSTRAKPSVKRQHSSSTSRSVRLERDRESIQELAAFLKNRQPPPGNFMSIPESFDHTTPPRKLPFKMFRRQNYKKGTKGPRPMRLPDSAVAAKTISGKWHIAITIPLEHNHTPEFRPFCEPDVLPRNGQPASGIRTSPITVLKPVIEGRELPKPLPAEPIVSPRGSSSQSQLNYASFSSLINAEDTRALQNYYRQQSIQDSAGRFEKSTSNMARPAPLQTDFVEAASVGSRRQSQRTEDSHSGGTINSDASLVTSNRHSRGPSSTSSAPSIHHLMSLNGIEPGNRLPNAAKGQKTSLSIAALKSFDFSSPPFVNSLDMPADLVSSSVGETTDFDIYSAQLGKADIAQRYNASDITGAQVTSIRNVTRIPGPAPTRRLPDLPERTADCRSRSRSVHGSLGMPYRSPSKKNNDIEAAASGFVKKSPIIPAVPVDEKSLRQLRQEKVKALRSRDMAALKAKPDQQPIATNVAKGNRIATENPKATKPRRATTPSHQPKRRTTSVTQSHLEHLHCKAAISVMPVMVVADIEPPFNDFYFPSPPSSPPRRESERTGNSFGHGPTPSRSVTPSLASSDDDALHLPRRTSTRRSSKIQCSDQGNNGRLDSIMTKEEDMRTRLNNLERNNTLILQTLSAVTQMGVGFRELQKLLPLTTNDGKSLDLDGDNHLEHDFKAMEGKPWHHISAFDRGLLEAMGRGINDLEPIMRELRLAASVGQETESNG